MDSFVIYLILYKNIVRCLVGSLFLLLDCLLEAFLEERQFGHEIGDCVHVCVFGRVVGSGLNAYDELMLERMRQFVSSEEDFWVFQQLAKTRIKMKPSVVGCVMRSSLSDHVAECVVFFVDCENCCIWDFCVELFDDPRKPSK